jgi:DNA-binding MarR family transcriptional regulator
MAISSEPDRVKEFLGSAHVFSSAISGVIERKLLQDSVGGALTVEQMQLLKLVSMREAHTIGDVAAFLEISKAAASKTVDKLVRKALLSRIQSETDRRSIKLSLTESSRRLLALYDAERERKLAAIFGARGTAPHVGIAGRVLHTDRKTELAPGQSMSAMWNLFSPKLFVTQSPATELFS